MRALSPLMEAAVAALEQRDPMACGPDPLTAVFRQAREEQPEQPANPLRQGR